MSLALHPLRLHPVVSDITLSTDPIKPLLAPPRETTRVEPDAFRAIAQESSFQERPYILNGQTRMERLTFGDPRPSRSKPPPAWSTAAIPPWSTATRPLSDIREITEPSLIDLVHRKPIPPPKPYHIPQSYKSAVEKPRRLTAEHAIDDNQGRSSPLASPSSPADRASIYSIPDTSIPQRSSSALRRQRSSSRQRGPNPAPPPPTRGLGYSIPSRGQSRSPIRLLAARKNPAATDSDQAKQSRTFRTTAPPDVLEFPIHRHPRIDVDLQVPAPLFVGGSSIEGNVRINIDEAERQRHRKTLSLTRITVDLVGVEEMSPTKRHVFLSLATEVVDPEHPPPHTMVQWPELATPSEAFWVLAPSLTNIPFNLSLPLEIGPPPFQSKHARIRYVLSVTLCIREAGRDWSVRDSHDVIVLTVFDPEKALMSLSSPLTACDEYFLPKGGGVESIRVIAGLHRQVWVSGTSLFTDVHIENNSRKGVKRIELQLERDILCYKHAAASTMEKSASQARIFDSNERTVLSKTVMKHGMNGWSGVEPHSSDMRTCGLELPRGHGTVRCGKYFEVRYFLNIIVSSSHMKFVTVQLPIILIHMNSLDVVPNSVAQVATAIEEKRGGVWSPRLHRTASQRLQGRAFAAPRMQSLDRMRAQVEDIQEVGKILEASPRRTRQIRPMNSLWDFRTPPSNRKGRVFAEQSEELRNRLRHVRSNASNRSTRAKMGWKHDADDENVAPRSHWPGLSNGGRAGAGNGELLTFKEMLERQREKPPSRESSLKGGKGKKGIDKLRNMAWRDAKKLDDRGAGGWL